MRKRWRHFCGTKHVNGPRRLSIGNEQLRKRHGRNAVARIGFNQSLAYASGPVAPSMPHEKPYGSEQELSLFVLHDHLNVKPPDRQLLLRGRIAEDGHHDLLRREALDGVLYKSLDGGDDVCEVGVPAGTYGHGRR